MNLDANAAARSTSKFLIEADTKELYIELKKDGHHYFKNIFLEKNMKERGVDIPRELRDEYSKKKVIFLEDPEFYQAFQKIYWENHMDHSVFIWKEDS